MAAGRYRRTAEHILARALESVWHLSILSAADALDAALDAGVFGLDVLEDLGLPTRRADPVVALLENMVLHLDDLSWAASTCPPGRRFTIWESGRFTSSPMGWRRRDAETVPRR